MKKQKDYSLLAVLLVILIAVLASSCTTDSNNLLGSSKRITITTYYYNAYSPLYDEYFIIKSYKPLQNKEIIWFDDNATAVDYSTQYVAMIISPYNK